jgi:hypothetical protein
MSGDFSLKTSIFIRHIKAAAKSSEFVKEHMFIFAK